MDRESTAARCARAGPVIPRGLGLAARDPRHRRDRVVAGVKKRERARLKLPPDWRLTLVLIGVALGLLVLLVYEVAERYF
jgi:hypothetical protein